MPNSTCGILHVYSNSASKTRKHESTYDLFRAVLPSRWRLLKDGGKSPPASARPPSTLSDSLKLSRYSAWASAVALWLVSLPVLGSASCKDDSLTVARRPEKLIKDRFEARTGSARAAGDRRDRERTVLREKRCPGQFTSVLMGGSIVGRTCGRKDGRRLRERRIKTSGLALRSFGFGVTARG